MSVQRIVEVLAWQKSFTFQSSHIQRNKMAKTAPLKNRNAPSKHSRAAKRASSPSINTDKSLKEIKPPVELKQPVLAARTDSGVKKSKGRKTVLSSKARKRREKTMDRAEAVMDRTETKVEKSKGRARNVQERSKAWDDLNKKALAVKKAKDEQEGNWEDMEEDDIKIPAGHDEIDLSNVAATPPTSALIASTIPAVPLDRVEDEEFIL